MVFANINTVYLPLAASAGASLWGTDVRKVLASPDATSDATTKTDHSTGGAVVRTVDPFTTSTTDTTESNFGFAIAPSDMGGSLGARRYYPAGAHTLTARMGHTGATAADGTLFMYAYKVGVGPGRIRTLLGNGSATVSFPLSSGEVTAVVTATLPEVIFEPDETIQYSYELSLAGIALLGRIATLFTGTQTAVAAKVVTPGLRVLADTVGNATGLGDAAGVMGKVLNTIGTATGLGSASGVMGATSTTTGSAFGLGTVTGLGSSVAGAIGSASGSVSVSGLGGKVLGTV
jgi:hypothetical protein